MTQPIPHGRCDGDFSRKEGGERWERASTCLHVHGNRVQCTASGGGNDAILWLYAKEKAI